MSYITIDSARLSRLATAALDNIQDEYSNSMNLLDNKYTTIKAAYDAAVAKSKEKWWSALPSYPDDLVAFRREKGWNLQILQKRSEVPNRILVATSLVNEVNVDLADLHMLQEWANA
jgi:hypothetical protein